MKKQEFDSFFKQHSENVDNAKRQGFWKLTDDVLKKFLLDNIDVRDGITLIDFGGGTGRWLLELDQYFQNSNFIIVDLSEDMLGKAKEKADAGLFKNKLTLMESDISSIAGLKDNTADYIISTYNPLSFVDKPQEAIDEAFRVLKPGGKAMITVQGYHNALYSKVNNMLADADELRGIFEDKKVKWNNYVPYLWQLPREDMEQMFTQSGFSDLHTYGIACIVQPQGEDFDPTNQQIGALSKKLNEDEEFYKVMFEIECSIGTDKTAANRAMNLLTVGRKKA